MFLVAAFILISSSSFATTFYVSDKGSDTNSGTQSAPFKTIQKAADRAIAGDIVLVMEGAYAGFVLENKKGTASSWIVFKPYNGQKVIIDINTNPSSVQRAVDIISSSYIEVNGFVMTDTNPLYDSDNPADYRTGINHEAVKLSMEDSDPPSYIRIINNHISHIGFTAIYASYYAHHCEFVNNEISHVGLSKRGYGMYIGGDDHIIRGNTISDAYGHAIHVYSEGGPRPDRNIIENNRCFNNGHMDYGAGEPDPNVSKGRIGDGIVVMGGGENNIIQNNLVYNNICWGIRCSGRKSKIINNTAYSNGYQGIYLYDNTNSIVRNNLSLRNKSEGTTPGNDYIGAGTVHDHNSWNLNLVDPQFINPGNGDFHLLDNATAINRGSGDGAPSSDFDGNPRPLDGAWDLGAYEYTGESFADLKIVDIKITEVNGSDQVPHVIPGTWYDLIVSFAGWSDISFADVWLSHSSSSEGSVANRGGRFFAESNYVLSYSISTDQIWACETEGSNKSTNITGRCGLYIDDDQGEYVQNSQEQWAKARFRWLDNAWSGQWTVHGYIVTKTGQKTGLFATETEMQSKLSDNTPPSKPQEVQVHFIND